MAGNQAFSPRSFAVVGAGPVGCIVAAFLAGGGHEVTLCDVVPELVEPAVSRGIIVEGAENLVQRISHTVTQVDELARYDPDVVFIAVKANALPLIASALERVLRDGTFVVSWQNGIDTERELARTLGAKNVMRAVVNYGCGLSSPGNVRMPFHHPPHYIQAMDPECGPAAEDVAQALTRCGLETRQTDRIISMVWRKAAMNASMNPVCAVTGLTISQAMNDPVVLAVVESLAKECVKVARANEIHLGWDYYPNAMDYLNEAGNHKPSMLVDIEKGRRTEIDYINGKFVEYGRQAGIETPYNTALMSLVKGIESRI